MSDSDDEPNGESSPEGTPRGTPPETPRPPLPDTPSFLLIKLVFNTQMNLCDIGLQDVFNNINVDDTILQGNPLELSIMIDQHNNNETRVRMTPSTNGAKSYGITLDQLLRLRLKKTAFSHIIKLLLINKLTLQKSKDIPFLRDVDTDVILRHGLFTTNLSSIIRESKKYIETFINPYFSLIIDFINSPLLSLVGKIRNIQYTDENPFEIDFISEFMNIIKSATYSDPLTGDAITKNGIVADSGEIYNHYRGILPELIVKLKQYESFINFPPESRDQARDELYIFMGLFCFIIAYTETIMYQLILDKFNHSRTYDYDIDAMFYNETLSKFFNIAKNCFASYLPIFKLTGAFPAILGDVMKELFMQKKIHSIMIEHERNVENLTTEMELYKKYYKNSIGHSRIGPRRL